MNTLFWWCVRILIVLGFAAFAVSLWHLRFGGSVLIQDRERLHRTLSEAVWQRYGPGSQQVYDVLLGYTERGGISHPGAPILAVVDEANRLLGFPGGTMVTSGAPTWLHEALPAMEAFATALAQARAHGPYLAAPDEPTFQTMYARWPSWTGWRGTPLLLRALATSQWARGEHRRAVETLALILELNDAFRHSLSGTTHYWRIQWFLRTFLTTVKGLLLRDPTPTESLLLLETTERIEPESWSLPEHCDGLPRLIDLMDPTMRLSMRRLRFVPPLSTDGMMLAALLWERARRQEANGSITSWGPVRALGAWTAIPAAKRRALRHREELIPQDRLLTPEQARAFPPLLYVTSFYRGRSVRIAGLAHAQASTLALRTALRVRCWRDRYGAWPDTEAFAELAEHHSALSLQATTQPEPLLVNLLRLYKTAIDRDQDISDEELLRDRATLGPPVQIRIPLRLQRSYGTKAAKVDLGSATEALVARWAQSALEACRPLIAAVTVAWKPREKEASVQENPLHHFADLVADLNLPRRTWWVVYHPPLQDKPAPPMLTKPSSVNCTLGDCSVAQLAGWDW